MSDRGDDLAWGTGQRARCACRRCCSEPPKIDRGAADHGAGRAQAQIELGIEIDVILGGGADALALFTRLEAKLEEFNDNLTRIQASLKGFGQGIANEALPWLNKMVEHGLTKTVRNTELNAGGTGTPVPTNNTIGVGVARDRGGDGSGRRRDRRSGAASGAPPGR